jgi:hypothetical protein
MNDARDRSTDESLKAGVSRSLSSRAGTTFRAGISVWACLLALALPAAAQSANATPPTIVQGALTGSVYMQSLAATGPAPITWSVTSGSTDAAFGAAHRATFPAGKVRQCRYPLELSVLQPQSVGGSEIKADS